MSMRRMARAAFLLALLALAAVAFSAKCYPPNTRVVVFIQGVYSSYDANGTVPDGLEDHTFDHLKAAFVAKGYDRAKLLDFSYAGGTVDAAGTWHPAPYGCELTDRTSDQNLVPLEAMLRDYRAKHPKVHFALVAHSLGGYLAFLEGAREAARPDDQKLDIDVVVAISAPLKGVSADKKTVIDLATPCPKTYLAGAELIAARQDPNTPAVRATQAAAMAHAGIRLATLGSLNDCLYNVPPCLGTGTNETDTQFLDGQAAYSRAYDLHVNPLLSHFATVAGEAPVADAVTFVGAP
ncbi:MAG TPA: hypothetical protein VFC53_10180 [Dehalococcoidia bacterium]|nr:hypothetical protein [Dehalococcoidia bacterium]